MYGIFTYIRLNLMVNVGEYTIHGSYGQIILTPTIPPHLDGLASRNPSSARYPWVSVHHRRCPVHCVSRSRVMCRFVVDVYGMLVLFNNLFLVLKVIKFLTEHNQRIDLYYIYICYVVAHCFFNVFFCCGSAKLEYLDLCRLSCFPVHKIGESKSNYVSISFLGGDLGCQWESWRFRVVSPPNLF